MAEQAQFDEQRQIVRELLKDPGLPTERMQAKLAERGLSIGEMTIEQVRKIVGLVLEEQASERKILRARPLQGEVDHEALSREIIARFPNILAALAE